MKTQRTCNTEVECYKCDSTIYRTELRRVSGGLHVHFTCPVSVEVKASKGNDEEIIMLKKIVKFFSKDIKRGRVIHMQDHASWGNSIHWSSWPDLKVHGHVSRCIERGDILTCDFTSGKKLEFQFISVEHCLDPRDQFFGELKYIGEAI